LSGDIDGILNWDIFFCIITGQDFEKAF